MPDRTAPAPFEPGPRRVLPLSGAPAAGKSLASAVEAVRQRPPIRTVPRAALEALPDAAPVPATSAADRIDMVEMAAELLGAYVAHNILPVVELPGLIATVHGTLVGLGRPASEVASDARPTPPVSVKKSIGDDFLVSLEDGKRYKSLKRHLSKHGLTPEQYRIRWGLPSDYPMVAPAYARARSEPAKTMGLGQQRRKR